MKKLVFVILIVFGIAFVVGCASSTSQTPQAELPIEDGWVRLKIEDFGSIDYPSYFLELQSEDYRDIVRDVSPNTATQFLQLGKSDFTLQQVGLNEQKQSAFEEYRRLVFRTFYLSPGEEEFKAEEKYTMSQQDLAEIQNEWVSQLSQEYAKLKGLGLGDNKIIDHGSIEIVELNRLFPLVWSYKRQLNDNPVVLVKQYVFFNYDKRHHLSFSCRVVDEEKCRDLYEKILDSFRF